MGAMWGAARLRWGAFALFGLLLLSVGGVEGSKGDRGFFFNRCVRQCPCHPPAKSRPLALRLLGWTCVDECRYDCMHKDVEYRAARGMRQVGGRAGAGCARRRVFTRSRGLQEQYFGKWPFTRLFYCQEFASALFSVANFVPHFYWFRFRRERYAPARYHLSPQLRAFSVIAMCVRGRGQPREPSR